MSPFQDDDDDVLLCKLLDVADLDLATLAARNRPVDHAVLQIIDPDAERVSKFNNFV